MRVSKRIRIALPLLAGLAALTSAASGCDVGNEGERCNPSLSHDECNSGLKCTQPPDCPENYCCPTSGTSDNPFCQPGCAGGQASICMSGGDARCEELGDGGDEG
jgi:hypothetical protein